MKNELHKSTLRAGKRTYFFDVSLSAIQKPYLEITESKKKDDGSYEKHSIIIFNDDFKHFKNEIIEIYERFFMDQ